MTTSTKRTASQSRKPVEEVVLALKVTFNVVEFEVVLCELLPLLDPSRLSWKMKMA